MFARILMIGAVGTAILATNPCIGQEGAAPPLPPIVTAISKPGAVIDGNNVAIKQLQELDIKNGMVLTVQTDEDEELMVYFPSGRAVLIMLGPAKIQMLDAGSGKIEVQLLQGRLMTASNTAAKDQLVRLAAPGTPSPFGIGEGCWVLSREDGYQPEDAKALTVIIEQLGLKSARNAVRDNLFDGLIAWDRRGQMGTQMPPLAEQIEPPEVRQTQTTAVSAQSTNQNSPTTETKTAADANTMPLLSPAAISVGGSRRATDLNTQAAGFAQTTGSRGLGFNGLSRLAVPGFQGRVRTLGPSGLAGSGPP